MSNYNPNLPNQYDQDFNAKKIETEFYQEYISSTPLMAFMGNSPYMPIQVKNIKIGEGSTINFPLIKPLDYTKPVYDYQQLEGTEQNLKVLSDRLELRFQRFADGIYGGPILKQMTPLKVYEQLQPNLMNASQKCLIMDLFNAATINLYPNKLNDGPVVDRVVYAGTKYEDTIDAGCKGMTDATSKTNGLTVEHIRKLRSMAVNGGVTYENESCITPCKLETRNKFPLEEYILLVSTDAYYTLTKDPAFEQFFSRGIIVSDQPQGIDPGRYRGKIENVSIYECPELSKYAFKTSDGKINAAWNVFMGAQALALGWSMHPSFVFDSKDYDFNRSIAVQEMRGQKALTFASDRDATKRVERGIIHSFTCLSKNP